MKNQYVGDIGDFGKYGLLRFLAGKGIRVGVNWYLTKNDDSADGRFTEYLKKDEFCKFDPVVFDTLKKVADTPEKNVQMIEAADLIPKALYYNEMIDVSAKNSQGRKWSRQFWFNNSMLLLKDADLIFADPDNGLTTTKAIQSKGSEKYVLPDELVRYYSAGKNVVYYCHKGRRTKDAWERAKVVMKQYLPDAQIMAVTYHKGTQRSYIFLVHPDDCRKYREYLDAFLETPWNKLFSDEEIREPDQMTDWTKNCTTSTVDIQKFVRMMERTKNGEPVDWNCPFCGGKVRLFESNGGHTVICCEACDMRITLDC